MDFLAEIHALPYGALLSAVCFLAFINHIFIHPFPFRSVYLFIFITMLTGRVTGPALLASNDIYITRDGWAGFALDCIDVTFWGASLFSVPVLVGLIYQKGPRHVCSVCYNAWKADGIVDWEASGWINTLLYQLDCIVWLTAYTSTPLLLTTCVREAMILVGGRKSFMLWVFDQGITGAWKDGGIGAGNELLPPKDWPGSEKLGVYEEAST